MIRMPAGTAAETKETEAGDPVFLLIDLGHPFYNFTIFHYARFSLEDRSIFSSHPDTHRTSPVDTVRLVTTWCSCEVDHLAVVHKPDRRCRATPRAPS